MEVNVTYMDKSKQLYINVTKCYPIAGGRFICIENESGNSFFINSDEIFKLHKKTNK